MPWLRLGKKQYAVFLRAISFSFDTSAGVLKSLIKLSKTSLRKKRSGRENGKKIVIHLSALAPRPHFLLEFKFLAESRLLFVPIVSLRRYYLQETIEKRITK